MEGKTLLLLKYKIDIKCIKSEIGKIPGRCKARAVPPKNPL